MSFYSKKLEQVFVEKFCDLIKSGAPLWSSTFSVPFQSLFLSQPEVFFSFHAKQPVHSVFLFNFSREISSWNRRLKEYQLFCRKKSYCSQIHAVNPTPIQEWKEGTGCKSINYEMSFWVTSILPKTNKKIQFTTRVPSSRIVFVHFLGELKTQKRHFEIN